MIDGYGILIQSTILPKKSPQIKINDNSGQIVMQSTLKKQMQKLKSGKLPHLTPKKIQPKKNTGIQSRIKKDQQNIDKIKFTQKNLYKCLQKKTQQYNQLKQKRINVDKLLVDFQAKQLLMTKNEKQQFEKQRQAFYKSKIKNIENQQKALHDNIQTENSSITQLRQRLAWQKQMLNQIKGNSFETNKPKVFQSFDHVMSKQEKQAFEKVINQEEQQKIKTQAIKRRKQIMQIQRKKKLRKLNIISDVQEAIDYEKSLTEKQNT